MPFIHVIHLLSIYSSFVPSFLYSFIHTFIHLSFRLLPFHPFIVIHLFILHVIHSFHLISFIYLFVVCPIILFTYSFMLYHHIPFSRGLPTQSRIYLPIGSFRHIICIRILNRTSTLSSLYQYLTHQGYKPSDIIIMGDSAGGSLAISTALYLCQQKKSYPHSIVALSPWVLIIFIWKLIHIDLSWI